MKEMVAAFDFDHTLTDRDSLLAFFFFLKGKTKTLLKLMKHLPLLIGFRLGLKSRKQVKEALFKEFLVGYSYEELQKKAKTFAAVYLPSMIKPKAFECLKQHLSQKRRCILVSASPDFYLIEWAKTVGIEKVLATRLELDADGKITGHIEGKNCREEEKVRRLLEYLGPKEHFILYAYGDSDGDAALLKLADYPFFQKFE